MEENTRVALSDCSLPSPPPATTLLSPSAGEHPQCSPQAHSIQGQGPVLSTRLYGHSSPPPNPQQHGEYSWQRAPGKQHQPGTDAGDCLTRVGAASGQTAARHIQQGNSPPPTAGIPPAAAVPRLPDTVGAAVGFHHAAERCTQTSWCSNASFHSNANNDTRGLCHTFLRYRIPSADAFQLTVLHRDGDLRFISQMLQS